MTSIAGTLENAQTERSATEQNSGKNSSKSILKCGIIFNYHRPVTRGGPGGARKTKKMSLSIRALGLLNFLETGVSIIPKNRIFKKDDIRKAIIYFKKKNF